MVKTIDTTPHWFVSERQMVSMDHDGKEEVTKISYSQEKNRVHILRETVAMRPVSEGYSALQRTIMDVGISADAIPALIEILQEVYNDSGGG